MNQFEKNQLFINKSKNKHGDIYDYTLVEYKSSDIKVKIICKKHGIFEQKPKYHLMRGCKRCVDDLKMMSLDQFILKSIESHGNLYDYTHVLYKGSKEKVEILCPKHDIFFQTPDNHIRGRGCPSCDISKKSDTKNFIDKSMKIHQGVYDYSLVNYQNSKSCVKIICNLHGIFLKSPNNYLKGQGCPECKKQSRIKKNNDFISDCVKIHNNKYDYSLVDYKSSNIKVDIICNNHGVFKQKPNNHLNGQGCPICKNSKGEEKISKFLEDNKVNYLREFKFSDCRSKYPLRFDFYLPDHNTCIEFNGIQHYVKIDYFSKNSDFEYNQLKDSIKRTYCEENHIKLIIIKYDDVILEKLKKLNVC